MNGATAAASRSQRRIGWTSQALTAPFVPSMLAARLPALVAYQLTNTETARSAPPAMATNSLRDSLEACTAKDPIRTLRPWIASAVDRGHDRQQVLVAPGALGGQPEVQGVVRPLQLAHRAQRGLGLLERRAAPGHDPALHRQLLGRLRARELARGRRRGAGVEHQASRRPRARVIEVPGHLDPGADRRDLDPASQRQRHRRKRERASETGVGLRDALQRLVHAWSVCDPAVAVAGVIGSRAMPDLRWGLTLPFAGVPLADHADLFRRAEAAGYDDLWTGETNGADGFTPLVLAAAHTERVRLGTGIVNPFTRGPAVLAQHAAALADASRGRFVLGLGSSSNVIVERWNGVPFERPLSKVREAVEALRGKMLALASEIADGAFTNFLPISGARQVAAAFGAPDKELVCRFFCVPHPEDEGMATARFLFAAYGTVPVYTEFFRWLGWGERIDPMVEAWHGGDRAKALELVPEDLVREIFLFGSAEQMRARLDEFAAAGITTFVLSAMCGPEDVPAF